MVEFKLNRRGIAELLNSPGLKADLESRIERVKEVAKETAPIVTGEYHDSIESGTYHDDVLDRPAAYVQAKVPYAAAVEVKHRTLGKALEAAR